jgi:Protein of unknown function (DUF1592)/Protein of unknown function (DUF1588)/Protein of unknown function (DUF1585)/Protein of unknown function (DUF1595)/Protein of unknown function (DUF1587)
MSFRFLLRILVILVMIGSCSGMGLAETDRKEDSGELKADAEKFVREHIVPFIKRHCLQCHSNKRPTEAGVNFSPALTNPGHPGFSQQWKKAQASVKAHDMPPADSDRQPTDADRELFIDGIARIKYLSEKDPGPFVIRRLTKTEYGNTLHDLLGVDPTIAGDLPDEVSGEGYLNSLSPLQLEHYLAIADKVLDRVLPKENSRLTGQQKRLFGDLPASDDNARTMAEIVVNKFTRQAYRRPPTSAEVDVLLQVFDLGRKNDLSYLQALRLTLKAILVSPPFLFITPSSEVETDVEILPLDDYQLASRLSYFLWSTMPDAELMDLADEGRLHESAILKLQVLRMLKDSRSRSLFDGFGAQWLGLGSILDKDFDPARFPEMTRELRTSMYDEGRLFFESVIRENRSIATFVTADYTYLNEDLASIYGLKNLVSGQAMRRVQLKDENRGGILAMPGILAASSFPNRTSAVKRGVWVLEQVLGDHVPSAPPDVPALEQQDQQEIAKLTLRERTELHRSNPVCANCHRTLDPIGFGLENFDAIGRWRESDDNGEAIDAVGELPSGERFSSPKELKVIIASQTDRLARNLVEKILAYALCRKLEGYDEIVVDELMTDIARDGYRVQTLVNSVVTSYPFTHRRIREEVDPK